MKIRILIGAMVALALGSCAGLDKGKVKVEGGYIQGEVTPGMTMFKGIPFAAPPVGDLRWKAPQPVIPWNGTLETKQYSAGPAQGSDTVNFNEDCLYLNVWTPATKADAKLPVLVWIYGGGFSFGSTRDPGNDLEALARKAGDVILVSLNYRVGQIGFFSHPELDAETEQHTSGNYGLLDQIAGLKWVQQNIAKFGGDPARVTIFGESAGGISVSMLCASPLAKGLFSGAISQSGGSFGPTRKTTYPGENMKTLQQSEEDCLAISERLGCKSLAELRALDASEFIQFGMGGGGAWPIVDGYVITDDQFVIYGTKNFNDVNVLIGYNSDEGLSFGGVMTREEYEASVRGRFGEYADKLMKAYPYDDADNGRRARDLMRDAAFGWHTWTWARRQAANGKSKVFLYCFDQHPDYPAGSPQYGFGSPHGQDVGYVFQHLGENQQTESDIALADAMARYWLDFARYGTPNKPAEYLAEGEKPLPEWPEFNVEKPMAMCLQGPVPYRCQVPGEPGLRALSSYFAWRRTAPGIAWGAAN